MLRTRRRHPGLPMLSYSDDKGHDSRLVVMACDLWALLGLNQWPLPCQGGELAVLVGSQAADLGLGLARSQ